MSYKFTTLSPDSEIQRLQREIEDNFVDQSDVENFSNKTPVFSETEPELKQMKNGDEIAYDDGASKWLYRRISGSLYKWQLTKV